MFRFLFGAAIASGAFYLVSHHPELVHRAMEVGRQQLAVATRNLTRAAKGEGPSQAYRPEDRPTAIDFVRVRDLVPSMQNQSSDRLWRAMDEDDYDRRAAAGQILLARAGIPASSEGVELIKRKYLQSGRSEQLMSGFSYLGLVALEDVPESSIIRTVQGYVERHPQEQACDNALWALGELGSDRAMPYFFEIIQNERKYGPLARERAFCCLVQCGRYSAAQRFEMVPRFIGIYEESRDPQTRAWAMQALASCAPGVRFSSIEGWKRWWQAQGSS